MFLVSFLKVVKWRPASHQLATIINTGAFLTPIAHQKRLVSTRPSHVKRLLSCYSSSFQLLQTQRGSGSDPYSHRDFPRNQYLRTMSTTSRDHPVLARLLSANEQWARDVEKAEPGFFQQMSKGQTPQVSTIFKTPIWIYLTITQNYRSFG
jgi:hypothetical protein